MDRETAIEFVKRIDLVFAEMSNAMRLVQTRLHEDDAQAFAASWSRIIGELDLGVLEVIYRAHPDLRPEGMAPVAPLSAGDGRQEPGA